MSKTAALAKLYLVISLAPIVMFTGCGSSYQHSSFAPDTVDVANIRFARNMYGLVQVQVREKNTTSDAELPKLQFSDSLPRIWRSRFPPSVIEKELLLKFNLSNHSDSVQNLYFYPGAYFS